MKKILLVEGLLGRGRCGMGRGLKEGFEGRGVVLSGEVGLEGKEGVKEIGWMMEGEEGELVVVGQVGGMNEEVVGEEGMEEGLGGMGFVRGKCGVGWLRVMRMMLVRGRMGVRRVKRGSMESGVWMMGIGWLMWILWMYGLEREMVGWR